MAGVQYDISLQESIPYELIVTVTDGRNVWATVGAFEARAQVRANRDSNSALRDNLTPFLIKAIVGNDVKVTLTLTGAQATARTPGYYDLVISDTGTTDAHAIRPIYGQVRLGETITAAVDA